MPLDDDVDLDEIANITSGFGADLEMLAKMRFNFSSKVNQ